MKENKSVDENACVHCGVCQKNCVFLKKYGIDIGDTEKLEELAYHCCLCGKCTEVCPIGIDGRQKILQIRRQKVKENNNKIPEKGYGMLKIEKERYLFRNYKNLSGKSVLFPGCNFPSFYPKTTRYLAETLKEKAGIGMVFDCCGKPIAELGMEDRENQIIEKIQTKLTEQGVEEIITLCPNCYAFLQPRLDIRVVSIYEKLAEFGIGKKIEQRLTVFTPCPDREDGAMLETIKYYLSQQPEQLKNIQCCGLGGCAAGKEPELADEMLESLDRNDKIYTYCASCAGNLVRRGYERTEHLLIEILGTKERPDTHKSLLNRMKTKYW